MHIAITILHVAVCIGLILVVLLQAGKGASMGAVFGGSSQTIFGSSGPGTFLSKMTTAVAIIFMLTSLGLSYLATQKGGGTMMKKVAPPVAPIQQPAAPAAMPAAPAAAPQTPAPAAQPAPAK
ncbi:MAG: preprotein translocase subunit SecG [Syntrophales bacterium]|nr:preprotein translocase subunit SecG [Syntrophales bacterium]